MSYPPKLDDKLSAWILTLRENDVAVSPEGKGANHSNQPQFRSMATGLHEVPQLVTESKNITVAEASSSTGTKLANFITKVKTSGRYPLAQIGNMDETPMYFDLGPSRTIERMGAKEVLVRTTGADKRHLTVVLTVTADGKMPPPMIIFKRKVKHRPATPPGVVVEVQEKGWMNQELMHVYVERIWRPFMEVAKEMEMLKGSLLILDSFSAHKTSRKPSSKLTLIA